MFAPRVEAADSLAPFIQVRDGRLPPAYQRYGATPVPAYGGLDESALWALHDQAMARDLQAAAAAPVGSSLLDLKIRLASEMLRACALCPNECRVDRASGERGKCGVGADSFFAHDFLHLGEDEQLVPTYAVFLGGCTMHCLYCRKWRLLEEPEAGTRLDSDFPARVRNATKSGARSIKFLGGTPEPHLPNLLAALRELDSPLPVIWESSMYISDACLRLAAGTVDLFLANLRYGRDECASALSGVRNYFQAACEATLKAATHAPVLIRHLVLPGHLDCCTAPIVAWAARHFRRESFQLLFQYVPHYRVFDHPELGLARRLTGEERDRAQHLFEEAFA